MPVKIKSYSEPEVSSVPLPKWGDSYTVIPHKEIIDTVSKELNSAGMNVTGTNYKMTVEGQIAQGCYYINYGNDPEMRLMFAWTNSYNKQVRFKCGIGAYVFLCLNGMLQADLGTYKRKHTGNALEEAEEMIRYQVSIAARHFDQLIQDREILKDIILTPRDKGAILGELFAEQEILTLTQTGIVKREMDRPSFSYSGHEDSAWHMYNHVTHALKESHPVEYIANHQKLHEFFMNRFSNPLQQIDEPPVLLEQIPIIFPEIEMEDYKVEPVINNGVMFL